MQKTQSTLVEQLVRLFSENKNNEKMLNYASKNYKILLFKINKFTPQDILSMYDRISKKSYHNPELYSEEFWLQNQLKVFVWTLAAYSFRNQLPIQEFTDQEWSLFSQGFNHKPIDFFQFQANFLLKTDKSIKTWTKEEQQLLKLIVINQKISNEWNFVARKLYKLSNKKFYKSPKQCRQRWLNHLDPSKKRSPWTIDEDIQLLSHVKSLGKKWAQISKLFLNTRTEHMVKNRYNAIVYCYCKTFPEKNQQQNVENFLEFYKKQKSSTVIKCVQKPKKSKGQKLKKSLTLTKRISHRHISLTHNIVQNTEITGNQTSKIITKLISPIKIYNQKEQLKPHQQELKTKKQTSIPVDQGNFAQNNEINPMDESEMQFFEQMDSYAINAPFLGVSQDEESFISQCLKGNDRWNMEEAQESISIELA